MSIVVENVVKDYPTPAGPRRVLDGVGFTVEAGDRVAILGRNGAGKSTLLRILGGVEPPTAGQVRTDMALSWPLGLAGGFQGSLTGMDNIRFVARVYGRPIDEVTEFVADFAELGSGLREPVKTYSSGMRARLAFGLSFAIDFDCYLIDEVIFVGDRRFRVKCQQELFGKRGDRTMILVSHDPSIMRDYCTRAVVLHGGRARTFDDPDVAFEVYSAL